MNFEDTPWIDEKKYQKFLLAEKQTQGVYYAQYEAFKNDLNWSDDFRPTPEFRFKRELVDFAESVRMSEFVLANWGKIAPINYSWDDPGLEGAEGFTLDNPRLIGIASRSARRDTVLHELAHIITIDNGYKPTSNAEAHGPIWASIYLKLIEQFINNQAATKVREKFDKFGVVYDQLTFG